MAPPSVRPRGDSLIGQVVTANVVLVTLTVFAVGLAAGLDLSIREQRWQFVILALVVLLTFCVNLWMLQRRFGPLKHLIDRIERIDPAEPATFEIASDPVAEIDRLAASFRRLLRRVDHERKRSGKLVLRAQEEERRRLARDLHDEVNQALTAVLLRLEALAQDLPPEAVREVAELKRLTSQAMEELLTLARQLRPAALDDHGLVPAIEAQLRSFSRRNGIPARLRTEGDPAQLDEEQQTALYRVAQEALVNAGRHSAAGRVEVELAATAAGTRLRIRDDGGGFDPTAVNGAGLGLEGMAERARLVGGELDVRSAPGAGTEVTMRLP
ncbi:MAG: sensor histidine kinase [Thermoleophilaceae bacterium]